jgi:hypothetical protein
MMRSSSVTSRFGFIGRCFSPRMSTALFVYAAGLVLGGPAHATPVNYNFSLTAESISGSVLGISTLPAAPFGGTFSFTGPLTASQIFLPVTLTSFSLTIGTGIWGLPDVLGSFFNTDAAGDIDPSQFYIEASSSTGGSIEISHGNVSNLGWYVIPPLSPLCAFDTVAPYTGVSGGNCMGGGPDSISLVKQPLVATVPEPSSLGVLAMGLLGIGAMRRRRKAKA